MWQWCRPPGGGGGKVVVVVVVVGGVIAEVMLENAGGDEGHWKD